MGKLALFVIASLCCLAFALIPETAMIFAWHLIQPDTELAKIVMLGIFWFGGAGLCVLFGFLGFFIWAAILSAI